MEETEGDGAVQCVVSGCCQQVFIHSVFSKRTRTECSNQPDVSLTKTEKKSIHKKMVLVCILFVILVFFSQLLSNVVAVDQKGNYPTKNRNKIQVDRKAVLSAVILVSATHENLPIACGYTRAVKPSAEQG